VENGGGFFVPEGYFRFSPEGFGPRGPYRVMELGAPYPLLRQALAEIRQVVGAGMRGFGDMSVDEIAERTGLPPAQAALAKQREYDEPFVLDGPPNGLVGVRRLAEARGLRCTSGGRFHHLMGQSDKGLACRFLRNCYRRHFAGDPAPLVTIALGDSLNDLPMLTVADRAILVRKPDGSYDPAVALPNLTHAPGIGPAGWNRALLELIGNR
jgi:mannosyl-3-phosphoglycerate phosphatase